MTQKSSFFILIFAICLIIFSACTSTPTSLTPPDQNTLETVVAATRQAASTSTQVSKDITPTVVPVPTDLPTSTTTPTALPSPTPGNTAYSGSRVAYIKGGNIWLWSEGAGPKELTTTQDAVSLAFSDDGEFIAFKRQNPDEQNDQALLVINTSGSPEIRTLVSADDLYALMPPGAGDTITGIGLLSFTWRPNSHVVAYNTVLLHEGPGFGPNYDLRLVSADTLEITTLFEARQGGIFYYSPDGSQIALSKPQSISLVNADGSNYRQDVLTFPTVSTHSEYYYCPHPIWASDSQSLRVAIPPEETLAQPPNLTGLWSIPVDGSPATLLSNILAIPFAWPNNAFAPDLAHVLYVKDIGDQTLSQRELHLADPAGMSDTVYDTGEALEFISWAPDSQHFTYLVNRGDHQGIYVGGLISLPVQLAPNPRAIINIQWVDGERFASLLDEGDQWSLQIRNLEGNVLATIDTLPDGYPEYDVLP